MITHQPQTTVGSDVGGRYFVKVPDTPAYTVAQKIVSFRHSIDYPVELDQSTAMTIAKEIDALALDLQMAVANEWIILPHH